MIPFILEPSDLSKLMVTAPSNELLLVDLSQAHIYQQAHLKGALHLTPQQLVSGLKPAVGKLPTISQLKSLFSSIGYTTDKHIVAYDDEGGGWAGRFLWTLDMIGHTKMSYLNGGIHAWLAEQKEITTEVPTPNQTVVDIRISSQFNVSKDEILQRLDDPKTVIWDARSPEEHSGQKRVSSRAGRIPGAINFEWTAAMDPEHQLRIRSNIVELLAEKGIDASKKIITHCQSHHRSGFTYLVGKSLGFDIQAYDGSWSEWGNDSETPVEVG